MSTVLFVRKTIKGDRKDINKDINGANAFIPLDSQVTLYIRCALELYTIQDGQK